MIPSGEFARAEASLVAQAHLLDAIFNHLARRSFMNMGQYLGAAESYMKLALKAQNQARATWEALARMKNPEAVASVQCEEGKLATGIVVQPLYGKKSS